MIKIPSEVAKQNRTRPECCFLFRFVKFTIFRIIFWIPASISHLCQPVYFCNAENDFIWLRGTQFSLIHTTETKYGIFMKDQRGYLLYIFNVHACICLRKGLLAPRKKMIIYINLYFRYYSFRRACACRKIMERKHSEFTGREGKVTAASLSNRHIMNYEGRWSSLSSYLNVSSLTSEDVTAKKLAPLDPGGIEHRLSGQLLYWLDCPCLRRWERNTEYEYEDVNWVQAICNLLGLQLWRESQYVGWLSGDCRNTALGSHRCENLRSNEISLVFSFRWRFVLLY
jgi:hypothetical protein